MSIKFILFLLAGTICMWIPIRAMGKKVGISFLKSVWIAILLTVVGTLGTLVMYYIENGTFGGISFFGAVFAVPPLFLLLSRAFRVPYLLMMDLCAVGECAMLAVMKVHCYISGCCVGRVLFTGAAGDIRFPSRAVEMAVAVFLCLLLYRWFCQSKRTGQLYAWYFILYGVLRFVLNWLRDIPLPSPTILPLGNIWSLLAMVVGAVWLLVIANRRVNYEYQKMRQKTEE